MQCPACRAVFSNGLDTCPRCKSALPPAIAASAQTATTEPKTVESPVLLNETEFEASILNVEAPEMTTTKTSTPTTTSTLLEFPGANRNMPQWRKDLSERVREIQERRARDAAREAEEAAYRRTTQIVEKEELAPQSLGLITSPEAPPMNPLVVAALRRIERARQPVMPRPRVSSGGAATAVARVVEEQYQTNPALLSTKDHLLAEKMLQKAHNLMVVAPKPAVAAPEIVPVEPAPEIKTSPTLELTATAKSAEAIAVGTLEQNIPRVSAQVITTQTIALPESAKTQTLPEAPAVSTPTTASPRVPRKVFDGVVDDAMLARREAEKSSTIITPASDFSSLTESYDDRAPISARLVANLIDLVVVAFISSPFAAIIELTNGNWSDLRVAGSMAGIVAVVIFLYATISTLLVGRTWGMSLVSLRAVDVETGLQPSTKQAGVRALVYIFSLALCGMGILYALFDAEGRTLHDHLSGTVVIRD